MKDGNYSSEHTCGMLIILLCYKIQDIIYIYTWLQYKIINLIQLTDLFHCYNLYFILLKEIINNEKTV